MEENNLISESLIYYDQQKKKYKKYYNNKYNLELHSFIDSDKLLFTLYDNNNIIMKGDYNFIGSYYKELKTFKWGWDYIYINNQITRQLITTNTYYLKKIIDYILSLYNNEKVFDHEIEKITFYYDIKKMFLVNEFKIRNILELEILLAITLYITKSDLIYKLYNEKQKCNDYYILRNINIINK